MTSEMKISCPHCGRDYNMKIDPERLKRLKTRATCGRCGKTFDVASRVAASGAATATEPTTEPTTEPKLPRVDVAATPVMLPTAGLLMTMQPLSSPTMPDLSEEMEELAREFAEAAARFTPVGAKRQTGAEEPTNPGVTPRALVEPRPEPASAATPATEDAAPPLPTAARDAEPIATESTPFAERTPAGAATSIAEPPPADAPPAAAEPPRVAPAESPPAAAEPPRVAPAEPMSLDAEPASADEELAAIVPTRSRAAVAPRSWLELADPGLASLQSPPARGAAALEALLNESETIALPPPPAAS